MHKNNVDEYATVTACGAPAKAWCWADEVEPRSVAATPDTARDAMPGPLYRRPSALVMLINKSCRTRQCERAGGQRRGLAAPPD